MARIDFHSNVADKLLYCCRLSRKILASADSTGQHRTIVIVGNLKELQDLDIRIDCPEFDARKTA